MERCRKQKNHYHVRVGTAACGYRDIQFRAGRYDSGECGRRRGNDCKLFASYRTERSTTRNEELLQLDSILEDTEAGSEAYEEAMALKLEIVRIMERELLLETYIKSIGYQDAVVSIGMDSDNVNVFVNATELAYNDFLSIYNILTEEAGCDPANVNIMPINSES